MKHVLLSIIFSLLASCIQAQEMDSLAQRVHQFGKGLPQEKVFVHMDNSSYFLGDTIFYKAYVTRSDNGRLSTLSGVLYVELLNQDGYLVERQVIRLSAGMGDGMFVLPTDKTAYSGFYELRAYTRWMLNFGRTVLPHKDVMEQMFLHKSMAEEFYRDYDKLYSRVFPVYDAPETPGEYYQDMTGRPRQRLYGDRESKEKTIVTLYPEGGNMVNGVPCRLYFEAATESGRHVRGTLTVSGSSGTVEGTTQHRGKGVVEIPSVERGMSGVFTDIEGNRVNVHMPATVNEGVTVRPMIDGEDLHIVTEGNVYGNLSLTVMHAGVVQYWQQISAHDRLSLPIESLPQGVLDITVYDDEGRILADRLVFNASSSGDSRLVVDGQKTLYEPYAPIELTVKRNTQSPNKSVMSVAITDADNSSTTYDCGNIMTEMLLCSEIKGFVEAPDYYFEADDELHRAHLDLLMATQGWRRFSWQVQSHPEQFVVDFLNEPRTARLEGGVYRYAEVSKNNFMEEYYRLEHLTEGELDDFDEYQDRVRNRNKKTPGPLPHEVKVHAEFISPGESPFWGEQETKDARFVIEQPDFDGQFYMHLAAADTTDEKKMKRHQWVVGKETEYPDFYVHISDIYLRHPHPYSFYQTQMPATREGDTIITGSFDDRLMSEVVVRRKSGTLRHLDRNHPAVALSAYQAFNMVCDAGLCPGTYINGNRFAIDVARVLMDIDMGVNVSWDIGQSIVSDFKLDIGRSGKIAKLMPEPMREPGETPNEFEYRVAMAYIAECKKRMSEQELGIYDNLENIDSVYVYSDYSPREYGNPLWNDKNQPRVTVYLKAYTPGDQLMTYRDRFYVRQGFNQCEDFYSPDYSCMTPPATPQGDTRRTLLWLPYAMFNADGELHIKAYNNGKQSRIRITVNGIDSSGLPLAN